MKTFAHLGFGHVKLSFSVLALIFLEIVNPPFRRARAIWLAFEFHVICEQEYSLNNQEQSDYPYEKSWKQYD